VAIQAGITAGVCGEMASEPLSAVLLIGMGYHSLSVSPQDLALIKWVIRNVPYEAARQAAGDCLAAPTAADVTRILQDVVSNFIDMRLLESGAVLPGSRRSN